MQARTKRDLYDTLRIIKGDFEGRRWILRNLQDKHSVLECHIELAGILRDVEGSRGKIPRANNFTESLRVLRKMLQDVDGKSRKLTKYHKVRGSKTQKTATSKIALLGFLYNYKRHSTLFQKHLSRFYQYTIEKTILYLQKSSKTDLSTNHF